MFAGISLVATIQYNTIYKCQQTFKVATINKKKEKKDVCSVTLPTSV